MSTAPAPPSRRHRVLSFLVVVAVALTAGYAARWLFGLWVPLESAAWVGGLCAGLIIGSPWAMRQRWPHRYPR